MRSFFITALCLSLIDTSYARVAHPLHEPVERDAVPEPKPAQLAAVKKWFGHLIRKDLRPRQDNGTCYEDTYYNFVNNLGPEFCQLFMHYPNITVVEDVTPTSTVTIITTRVATQTDVARVTPTITETVTAGGPQRKRDVEPSITPPAVPPQERIDRVFQAFRRQNGAASADTGTAASASLSSAFSSACSCQDYTGPTVTVSYTDAAEVETLQAFVRSIETLTSTRTAAPVVVTETVTVQPTSSSSESSPSVSSGTSTAGMESGTQVATSSGSSGSPSPTSAGTATTESQGGTQTSTSTSSGSAGPTAPAFVCPEDNNTTVSQMIGSERFDYLVLCDTILGDSDFYVFNYATFGECVASCSLVDARFDYPLCQGVSFYGTAGSSNGGNCHLKRTASQTFPSAGIDTAILQRIALGISSNATDGTTTDVPSLFVGPTPTQDPQELSSSVSSLMSNVSAVITVTSPASVVHSGMLGNGLPITAFSTYVSAGSTYSSGTTYSFATTYANGSWYSAYYYTWTETWASATTVYGASATGYIVQNSTNSQTDENQGENGETIITTTTNTTTYDEKGYNITEVISYQTLARNGSDIGSSATTTVFSFETAAAGGGSTVGPASAGAGPITSTSVFSTQSVIVNSGATGGGTSFATGGGPPSTTETVVVSTGGTAFSTVIVNSGATGGASSGGGSGGPGETGGASGTAASGGPSSTEASQVSQSVVSVISGTPSVTGGESGTAVSGGPSSSSSTTFTNSRDSRNGEFSTGSSSSSRPASEVTESVVTVISGTPSATGGESPMVGSGGPSSLPSGSIPPFSSPPVTSSSSSTTFTNSRDSRNGEYSTSSSRTITPSETVSTISNSSGLPTFPSTGGEYPSPSSSPVSSTAESRTGEQSTTSNTTTPNGPSPYPSPSSSVPPTSSNSTIPPRTTSLVPYPPLSSPSSSVPPTSNTTHTWPTSSSSSTTCETTTSSPTPIGYYTYSNGERIPYYSTPFSPLPPYPTPSCSNLTQATTTIFTTVTELGCYSSCIPRWSGYPGGGYGGPLPFGPETFGPPVISTGSSATSTETSSATGRRR